MYAGGRETINDNNRMSSIRFIDYCRQKKLKVKQVGLNIFILYAASTINFSGNPNVNLLIINWVDHIKCVIF